MAWTAGHSEECTTTVPATTDGALTDYTMMLSHLDFPSGDRDAIADYLAAGQYEASSASDGSSILGVLATDIDTTANTFRLWVKYTTSAVSSTDIYWRFGAAVTHSAGDQVDADVAGLWPQSEDFDDYSGNANDGTASGGVVVGGSTAADGLFDATDYDGSDDFVNTGLFPDSSHKTYTAWLRFDSTNKDFDTTGVHDRNNHRLYLGSNFGSFFYAWGSGFEGLGGSITLNVWYLVSLVEDSGTVTCYLDGVQVETFSASFSGTSNSPILLGARSEVSSPSGAPDRAIDGQQATTSLHTASRSAAWIATDHDRQGTLGQASSTALATIGGGGGVTYNGLARGRQFGAFGIRQSGRAA